MNLITLATHHSEKVRINAEDLNHPLKKVIPMYNRKGERYDEWNTTKKQRENGLLWGVHKDNLFADKAHADAEYERFFQ